MLLYIDTNSLLTFLFYILVKPSSYLLNLVLQNLTNILSLVKDVVIIAGVVIALLNYRSQVRQRAIENSIKLVDSFKTSLKTEVEVWENIFFNSLESSGVEPNHFLVYDSNHNAVQIPIVDLFIQEGSGLLLWESKLLTTDKAQDIVVGDVRRITEQFNLIGYEVLYGNIEIRNLYYEIGQIMDVIYSWIENIEDEERKQDIQSYYSYFIRMYKRNKKILERCPRKSYINFC